MTSFATVNGVRLAYDHVGQAYPMLLGHGFPRDRRLWRKLGDARRRSLRHRRPALSGAYSRPHRREVPRPRHLVGKHAPVPVCSAE